MSEHITSLPRSRPWATRDGQAHPPIAVLSLRERYARGEIDESDAVAPARGMALGVALSGLTWVGIASLVMLFLAR